MSHAEDVCPREGTREVLDVLAFESVIRSALRRAAAVYGCHLQGEDLEDVAQEIVLALWRDPPRCHPNAAVAFLRKTARNALVDRLRRADAAKRGIRRTVPLAEGASALGPDASPESQALQREDLRLALSGLRRHLSPRLARVFWLRVIQGFTSRETAARLGTTVAAVDSACSRARRRIDAWRRVGEVDLHKRAA